MQTDYHPSRFTIDGIDTAFEGFTNGQTWNGWACPIFPRDTALQVLKAGEDQGWRWRYDAEQDAFIVQHDEDPDDYEPLVFTGTDFTMIDGTVGHGYGIGAYTWTWTVSAPMDA